jgi:glycosyltransferase involved in cell wall biosynthesis
LNSEYLSLLDVISTFIWLTTLLSIAIIKRKSNTDIGPPVFEWIIAKVFRKKFIYDFDDAIWLPNYSQSNVRFHQLKAYWKIKKIISWADQVVVGNSYLKDYALQFNPNVKIIPTTIDTINVHNKCTNHDSKKIIIGWTGSHTTMGYLPYLLPVLKELEKKFNFKFRVISNHPPPIDLDSLEFVKWNKKTEIKDLAEINIGVMPLEDSIWAQGKCGFKGLQYMALQIPSVMSNVGVNTQIIDDGHNGFICKSKEDWYRVLSSLMSDVKLRTEIGQKGKKTVEHKYSVKANKQKYNSLFK